MVALDPAAIVSRLHVTDLFSFLTLPDVLWTFTTPNKVLDFITYMFISDTIYLMSVIS
jgi:hypothetical protein